MKKTIVLLITTILSIALFAQNENDALRYSLINYSGTARFSGLSGAYGALGADFSSLSQNPAGIGLFRRSEFSITPVFNNSQTESNYMNGNNSDYHNKLFLGNVGYVMALRLNENNSNHLKQVHFGIGMNRMGMFNNRMIISSRNDANSLLTQYLYDADNSGSDPNNLDNFGSGLAYDVNLLYKDKNGIWQVDLPDGKMKQTKTIVTKGGTVETVLSAGANFDNKLFLGATFGFAKIEYEEESKLTEQDDKNLSEYLKSFNRTEYLNTKGNGFTLKLGFIYKPFDFIRIGGAIHTPTTYYEMNDVYTSSMSAIYDKAPLTTSDKTIFDAKSPEGNYNYKLTTPLRAMGSIAIVLAPYGLISADYEHIDYSTARLRGGDNKGDTYDFMNENNTIKSALGTADNFRFGTEWKVGIFAVRGGYSLYGSPYKGKSTDGARKGYSLGFGVLEKTYFLDFSYNHIAAKDKYYIYSDAPISLNNYTNNSYSLTLGFRF